MPLASFLSQLSDGGRVRVARLTADDACDASSFDADAIGALQNQLATFHTIDSNDAPGELPALDLPAARWAAITLFRAAQFLISREVDQATIERVLAPSFAPPTEATSDAAKQIASVDLTLRYLPDLIRLAFDRAPGDPLIRCLRRLAVDWPLSSVGLPPAATDLASEPTADSASPTISDDVLAPILDHPSLRQRYLDRIVRCDDPSRLTPKIVELLRSTIGDHPSLLPPVLRDGTQPDRGAGPNLTAAADQP